MFAVEMRELAEFLQGQKERREASALMRAMDAVRKFSGVDFEKANRELTAIGFWERSAPKSAIGKPPLRWEPAARLQLVAEADAFGRAFFLRGGRDAEAGVAGAEQLDEAAGVSFEGVGIFRKVEPFTEDGVRGECGKIGAEAGVVFVKGADEHALPGFALGCQEKLVTAVEHDGAAAEPGLEDEGGFVEERLGEPLERVVGLDGAGADGGGPGGFHGGGQAERAGWSGRGGDRGDFFTEAE